jgi:hypothetical protein
MYLLDFGVFTYFQPPYGKSVGFGKLSVCLNVCMDMHLSNTSSGRFYSYLVFENLSVLGQCTVSINIPAPKHKIMSLLKTTLDDFD